MIWQIVFPHARPLPDMVTTYRPGPVRPTDAEGREMAEFLKRVNDIVAQTKPVSEPKGES